MDSKTKHFFNSRRAQKPDVLLKHLADKSFRDSRENVLFENRLGFSYRFIPGGFKDLAVLMLSKYSDFVFFPDANIAFRDKATPVWDALRRREGSTILTSTVESELLPWLSSPRHNQGRAVEIRRGINRGGTIEVFEMSPSHELSRAILGYTHLLGFRRLVARGGDDGRTIFKIPASRKIEVMNNIRTHLGDRAIALAKKGRRDFERKGKSNINDEYHCLMGILYAITHKKNVCILTTDADLSEILYKAQYLIDTHYRSWLLGEMIADGRVADSYQYTDETSGLFEGKLALVPRRTSSLQEVLPTHFENVSIQVVHVLQKGGILIGEAILECRILEMMRVRSRTDGRNSDRFGDMNIHVELGPIKTNLKGLFAGIGKDKSIHLNIKDKGVNVSLLDLNLAIFCREHHC